MYIVSKIDVIGVIAITMDIWSDRHANVCKGVIMVSTMCTKSSPIVCSPLTVV